MGRGKKVIWTIGMVFSLTVASGQTIHISGRVLDSEGRPLEFSAITIDSLNQAAYTDAGGAYTLVHVPAGRHALKVTQMGYVTQVMRVNITRDTVIDFVLIENAAMLKEVTISGERIRESRKIEETGFQVKAIDTKKFDNRPLDLNQVLNQATGVRIRETGGVGSDFSFYLNGLSGRQVKFFLDGQPLENYSSVMNLNNIPANLVERVEVYKGVVPVHLGADALGGGVNIVTRQMTENYLDASYSYGSFHTHRANASGQYRNPASGFTVRSSAFYNYSDNNYRMYNMETVVNGQFVKGNFDRFHDSFLSWLGNVELGFSQKKWADRFFIGLEYGTRNKDLQNTPLGSRNTDGSFAVPVAGEAVMEDKSTRTTLRYTKEDLGVKGLRLGIYAVYNRVRSFSIDSSDNVYNWKGEVIRRNITRAGELSLDKTTFQFNQQMFLQNADLVYEPDNRHRISFNYTFSYLERKGRNSLETRGNDPFADPNTLGKKVWGLAYQYTAFDDRWQSAVFVKHFSLDILARESRWYSIDQYIIEDRKTSLDKMGVGLTSRYRLTPEWLVKASWENARRMPEPYEIFGDGLLTLANPHILPEKSRNINAGTQWRHRISDGQSLTVEANGFYRNVDQMIFLRSGGVFMQYINMRGVLIRGGELELRYTSGRHFSAGLNGTYQDVLNNTRYLENTSTPNPVYRERMYNTPYLFGNTDVSYTFYTPGKWKLSLFYGLQYVHEFYLNYPSIAKGGPKFTIPSQLLHHSGSTLSSADDRYHISLECRNLTDTLAYDDFALQKPGRALYIKLRYFIKQNLNNQTK